MKEEDRARAIPLINEIISMYHTTRLSGVPAADHILSKPSVQRAFGAFVARPPLEWTRDFDVDDEDATPSPVIETEGSGEDDVEPWQQEAARQLGLLYNYHHDDRHQFTRWQMMTAIAHGSKLAGGSLDLRPVGAENVRERARVPGSTPRGGYRQYTGTGRLDSGGRVTVEWVTPTAANGEGLPDHVGRVETGKGEEK